MTALVSTSRAGALATLLTIFFSVTASNASAQCGCCCPLIAGCTMSMMGSDGASADGELGWDFTEEDAIYLTVNVPEAALVFVNEDPTISVGTTRYYIVRHLEPGKTYKFEVAAETLNPAGIPLEEKTTITLEAGQRESVTLKPYKKKAG